MKVVLTSLFGLIAMAIQVFADANAMKEALPLPPDGYRSEIEEESDAHMLEFAWLDGNEETHYIVEINFEGATVAGFNNTFRAMTLAMDTVVAGGQTFTFDGDMFTTLINKSVLVRVYGTASEAIKREALNRLDFAPLLALASGG